MRLVVQRVCEASVSVAAVRIAAIQRGLLVLAGLEVGDGEVDCERAAEKVAGLRVFADPGGKMNLALADVAGAVLAVSQFTLAGSIARGRRPSFDRAMAPDLARPLFDHFVAGLERRGLAVARGAFGADMRVALVNDGPVTFVYETRTGA